VLSGLEVLDQVGHPVVFGQTWLMLPGEVYDREEARARK
jgi:hypothetical protein